LVGVGVCVAVVFGASVGFTVADGAGVGVVVVVLPPFFFDT
jgi:hypothetical protein